MPLFPTPSSHINGKTCSFTGVNILKPLHLEGETCPLGIDHDHVLCFNHDYRNNLTKITTYKTKSIQMRLAMTTYANVQTSSTNNTMSTQ
jgi:hypothetical protein